MVVLLSHTTRSNRIILIKYFKIWFATYRSAFMALYMWVWGGVLCERDTTNMDDKRCSTQSILCNIRGFNQISYYVSVWFRNFHKNVLKSFQWKYCQASCMYHSILNMVDNRLILELLFNINIWNKGLNIYTLHYVIPF